MSGEEKIRPLISTERKYMPLAEIFGFLRILNFDPHTERCKISQSSGFIIVSKI